MKKKTDSLAKAQRSAGGAGKSGEKPPHALDELTDFVARGHAAQAAVDKLTQPVKPKDPAKVLSEMADRFNSDLVQCIGRDFAGNVTSVSVVARGPYAEPLLRFLKRLDAREKAAEARQEHE